MSVKNYNSNVNVFDASLERVKVAFEKFENVLVAFSTGKDSGVMLNQIYDYAKANNLLHRLAMYYMDYEADYSSSDEFAERAFSDECFQGIKKFWLCLPINAQCACSMHQNYWTPWDKDKQDIWVKKMPTSDYVVNEDNVQFAFKKHTYGAETRKDFSKWFSSEYGSTAVMVGIRADESLSRLAIFTSKHRVNNLKGYKYTQRLDKNTVAFYPIYDWRTEDVWHSNYKFDWDYNKIYDLMYMSGMSPYEMRVASPFHCCGQSNLKLYKAISPNTWGKMIGRVNGVNFTNIYGGTTAMGWKNITKPDHFTWEQYAHFLLDTLPQQTKELYLKKIEKSKWHWSVQGGAREEEFIQQLEDEGVKVRRTGQGSKACKVNTHKELIYIDEMMDDTKVKDFKKAPSWKRVCVSIMKNDTQCLYMGFSRTKQADQKRKNAIEKYKNL